MYFIKTNLFVALCPFLLELANTEMFCMEKYEIEEKIKNSILRKERKITIN